MKLIDLIKCSGLVHPEKVISLIIFTPRAEASDTINEFASIELNVYNLAKYADYDIDSWCIDSGKLEVMIVEPNLL